MINLYVTSTMDPAELESLNNWAQGKSIEHFFADVNEDAKSTAAKHNLSTFPVLIDVGHTDESPDEIVCKQLAVGTNAILAYNS